jgi:signal transduction histidine kinase
VDKQANQAGFLDNGGRTGRRIRSLDWSKHPLGPIETWDATLRTSLGIVLSSSFPTFLVWGEDLTLFFNDPYEPMLGQKAHSLGSPYPAVWHEVWDSLGPYIRRVLAGESFFFENYETTLERHGCPEQAWFTFSYNPLRDDSGSVRGLICTCVEVTDKVRALARRKDEFLAMLAHELHNPLAPISNAAQLPTMAGSNEQRIRQSSEVITRQVRQMTALVDDLLDVSPVKLGSLSAILDPEVDDPIRAG